MQKHDALRKEFIKYQLANLTDEEKALRYDVNSYDYIDFDLYLEWLETTLENERNKRNKVTLKRTK